MVFIVRGPGRISAPRFRSVVGLARRSSRPSFRVDFCRRGVIPCLSDRALDLEELSGGLAGALLFLLFYATAPTVAAALGATAS